MIKNLAEMSEPLVIRYNNPTRVIKNINILAITELSKVTMKYPGGMVTYSTIPGREQMTVVWITGELREKTIVAQGRIKYKRHQSKPFTFFKDKI